MAKYSLSMEDLNEITKASRELYFEGLMPIDEVRHFRKLLQKSTLLD